MPRPILPLSLRKKTKNQKKFKKTLAIRKKIWYNDSCCTVILPRIRYGEALNVGGVKNGKMLYLR